MYYSHHGLKLWIPTDYNWRNSSGYGWMQTFGWQAVPSLRRFMFYVKTKTSSYGWHHRRDCLIVLGHPGDLDEWDRKQLAQDGAALRQTGTRWSMSFWDPSVKRTAFPSLKIFETNISSFLEQTLEDGRMQPRLTVAEFEAFAALMGRLGRSTGHSFSGYVP